MHPVHPLVRCAWNSQKLRPAKELRQDGETAGATNLRSNRWRELQRYRNPKRASRSLSSHLTLIPEKLAEWRRKNSRLRACSRRSALPTAVSIPEFAGGGKSGTECANFPNRTLLHLPLPAGYDPHPTLSCERAAGGPPLREVFVAGRPPPAQSCPTPARGA